MTQNPKETTRIHVIFKTHLDVGFTNFAATVVENYLTHYIPSALALAKKLRLANDPDRFVWTTGSWLIYEYLEVADRPQRAAMEEAIQAGDIAWHGLPFTMHSELLDAPLFRYGLSLSQKLDARYGKHTIAAKMSDVPGHTRAIVPLLAEAGIKFLHIGVNGASTPPAVPSIFTWQDPSGADVLVMYHKGSYGDLMLVPGLSEGIAFAHTGDNLGPQSEEQLHQTYSGLHGEFPGALVTGSTLDAFAEQLLKIKQSLPVVTAEIGDTWIHGGGTDPQKISQYRQLLRWRKNILGTGISDEGSLDEFSRRLLVIPEHTWGMDIKTHLGDFTAYAAQDFKNARGGAGYKKVEQSWAEQRAYISQAIECLPSDRLKQSAQASVDQTNPIIPDLASFEDLANPAGPIETPFFTAGFDLATGAINLLNFRQTRQKWASPQHPMGMMRYETFSSADYARFYRQYVTHKRETADWSIPDFTKPGMGDAAPLHKIWLPVMEKGWIKEQDGKVEILFQLTFPNEASRIFGGPRRLFISYSFDPNEPVIHLSVKWFDKPASRLPEALWLSFIPRISHPANWRLEKLGELISPLDVVKDGNRHLHGVGKGIFYKDERNSIQIESLDSPLVAPGDPSLLNFNNRQPVLSHGMHFNLYNNVWGTNFPMWYEDPASFRFILRF